MSDEIIEIMARAIDEGGSYLLPGDDRAAPFRRAAIAAIAALQEADYRVVKFRTVERQPLIIEDDPPA